MRIWRSGGERAVVCSPTECSVVVLRLFGGPASVRGSARVVRGRACGGAVVGGVCVEEGESGGGGERWWRVLASGGSQRAGFGRRLAADGSDGAGQVDRAGRNEAASKPASKQSGVPRRKAAREQSRGEGQGRARQAGRSNARQQAFATSTSTSSMGRAKAGLCVPDDLPFAG